MMKMEAICSGGGAEGRAPGLLMLWLTHGTSHELFTLNCILAGYKDLLTWAIFNKISLCSPNHSRYLPSRRMWLLRWEEGHGRSVGQGRGRLTRPAEEGQVWACLRNSGKPPTLELDKRINLQLTGNLSIWLRFQAKNSAVDLQTKIRVVAVFSDSSL